MNDDELSPSHELASGYLDGQLDADERAQVEASPELVELVESFRLVRAQLAEVPPAPATARDAALAAALAEFDQRGLPPRAAAPVVSLASRRRWPAALMSAAAAVVLLGVAGIAVFGPSGDDEMSSADTSGKERLSEVATQDPSTESADSAAPASTIGSVFSAGDVAYVIDQPEQLLTLPPVADGDDTGGGTEASTTAPSGASPDTTAAGAPAVAQPLSSRPAIACLTPDQVYLADILYQGQFAIAARDTVTGYTVAIADDCSILATVGP
ncbi:MAG: hypothetical protein Q8M22_13750 [Actinomycetota bacterium]|nr:hypothetical protein [Actinomycetota bacterium]